MKKFITLATLMMVSGGLMAAPAHFEDQPRDPHKHQVAPKAKKTFRTERQQAKKPLLKKQRQARMEEQRRPNHERMNEQHRPAEARQDAPKKPMAEHNQAERRAPEMPQEHR